MADEEKTRKTSKKTRPDAATEVGQKPAAEKSIRAKDASAGATKEEGVAATAPTAAELLAEKPATKVVKAKGAKNVAVGVAHILATFNNTAVSITDQRGNVIAWSSAGKAGFKGSRKSTAYAAQMAAQDCGRQAMSHGMKEVEVLVSGPGLGRESAVRSLQAIGMEVSAIRDVTPMPHNGCRPRKPRRV